MIPNSGQENGVASKPPAVAIKKALDDIEAGKKAKEDIVRGAVEALANLNMVEELMDVHNNNGSKDKVFDDKKKEYQAMFAAIAEQDKGIEAAKTSIQTNIGDFQKLKQSVMIDPAKQQFF
jgi:hypothetical protein